MESLSERSIVGVLILVHAHKKNAYLNELFLFKKKLL